jgi:hypothetical protein
MPEKQSQSLRFFFFASSLLLLRYFFASSSLLLRDFFAISLLRCVAAKEVAKKSLGVLQGKVV